MKVLLINGSPRKLPWNTATILQKAAEGAQSAGAQTEIINLYDLDFKGCSSCFACKIKNAQTNGICAMRDALRPVLEKADDADVVIVGSPIYFSYVTGELRSFLERFMFPHMTYMKDPDNPGQLKKVVKRNKAIGIVYTMNVPEQALDAHHYHDILDPQEATLRNIFGYAETLWVCDTYQYSDYSKYDCDLFNEPDKAAHRDSQFPIDCRKAFELGQRLVQRAILGQ